MLCHDMDFARVWYINKCIKKSVSVWYQVIQPRGLVQICIFYKKKHLMMSENNASGVDLPRTAY